VALGSTTNATPISPADDQDWYKFTLDRESSVVIQTNSDNTVKNGDTHIYLYRDGSNRVLDENDDISLGRTRSSRLRFDCANSLDAGTYYVKVTSFQSEYEVGWYTLNVNASACSTSDGDSQSSAPGGYVQLVVQHSNKCLDVSNLSQDNGAKIQQWTCHGRDNQLWELRRVGNYHQIIAKHSGKCLAVRGTSPGNGNVLQQWTCDARQNNQLWQFIEVGDDYRLVAKHSGQCMDVSDVGYDNGAQLIQWDCHSGENQLWHVYPGNVTPPPPHSSGSATQTDDPPPEGQTTVLRHYAPNTHSYCGGETDIIQLAIQPIVDRSRLWIYVKKCDGGTFAKNGQYYIRVDGDRRFGPYQYRAGDLLSRQDITPPSPSTGDHRYTIELYPVGQSYPINSGAVVVEGRVEYE
jgi:hypothetical protein